MRSFRLSRSFSLLPCAALLLAAYPASAAPARSLAAQQHLNDQLVAALKAKHPVLAAVRGALAAGAQPNAVDSDGEHALSLAVENASPEVVSTLLGKGALPNAKDADGTTALMAAATLGQTDAARLLLAHHAAVEQRDSQGDTALLLAAGSGHTQIEKLLLDAGAQVSSQNSLGMTPLMMAAQTGQTLAAELLVQRGAIATARDQNGETPLTEAAAAGQTQFVQFLVQHGASIEDSDGTGRTPLLAAASAGQAETVSALLDLHADPNGRGDDGTSPLVVAAINGRVDVIKLLAARHADLQQADLRIGSPITAAAEAGQLASLKELIALGADVNATDDEGETPLTAAGRSKRVDVAALLLSKGAEINKLNTNGVSPLLRAVAQNAPELVTFLVRHGADLKWTSGAGSLIQIAIGTENEPMALQLLSMGAPVDFVNADGFSVPDQAASFGDVALMKAMAAKGVDFNTRNKDGFTPLMFAASDNKPEAARFLIHSGANLALTDNNGLTALNWAQKQKNSVIADMILHAEGLPTLAETQPGIKNGTTHFQASLIKPKQFEYVDGQPDWSAGLIHTWLLTEGNGDSIKDSVLGGETLTNRQPQDYAWTTSGGPSDSPAIDANLGAGLNFLWTPIDQLSSWTIAVKVRPLGTDPGASDSRCLWRDGNNWDTALYLYKGTQGFYIGGNPGHKILLYPLTSGSDYLVVVDNMGNLYVNGKSAGTFPALLGPISTGQFSWMSDGFGQGFGGLWYFARVWNRDLTPEEVASFSSNPYADLPLKSGSEK